MFILSSIAKGLELWTVNNTSRYKNSELKVFKIIKFFGEISINCPNYLWEYNARVLNLADNCC